MSNTSLLSHLESYLEHLQIATTLEEFPTNPNWPLTRLRLEQPVSWIGKADSRKKAVRVLLETMEVEGTNREEVQLFRLSERVGSGYSNLTSQPTSWQVANSYFYPIGDMTGALADFVSCLNHYRREAGGEGTEPGPKSDWQPSFGVSLKELFS